MTSRLRFMLLLIVSAMIAVCSTTTLLSAAGPLSSSAHFRGNLLAAVLILLGLVVILAVSGLLSDLIRVIAVRDDGTRNVAELAVIASVIVLGVILGGIIFQFGQMLAD